MAPFFYFLLVEFKQVIGNCVVHARLGILGLLYNNLLHRMDGPIWICTSLLNLLNYAGDIYR